MTTNVQIDPQYENFEEKNKQNDPKILTQNESLMEICPDIKILWIFDYKSKFHEKLTPKSKFYEKLEIYHKFKMTNNHPKYPHKTAK